MVGKYLDNNQPLYTTVCLPQNPPCICDVIIVFPKVEAKRKIVWRAALKADVGKDILIAVRKARTTEELDTLREPFSGDGNKKTKVQLALERGLGPLGVAIVTGAMPNNYGMLAHWQVFTHASPKNCAFNTVFDTLTTVRAFRNCLIGQQMIFI